MAYYFMMGVVPLPITPSSLSISTPSMNKTVTLINEGEINIPKDQGLREISFEFLLPTVQKYPFATWQLGSYTATLLIPLLNLFKRTKWSLPFIVVRMSPGGKFLYFTSITCTIETFEYKEDAEEYGLDTMCSITLKEYKPFGTKRVELKEGQNDSKNALTTLEPYRDSAAKTILDTLQTAVKTTLSGINPFSMRALQTRSNDTTIVEVESIVSTCKRNGDNPLEVLDKNNVKIPDTIDNKNTRNTLDSLGISNAVSYSKQSKVIAADKDSLADIMLFGSGTKKYKSPLATKNADKCEVQRRISELMKF